MEHVEKNQTIESEQNPSAETKRMEWSSKQKHSYSTLMTGLKKCSVLGKTARHVVLTTSNDVRVKGNHKQLYADYKEVVKRVRRLTPLKLVTMQFIAPSDLRKYYPNKPINEKMEFEYNKVRTSEGNGVLHVIEVGDFIPYHWLKDQWEDIHFSPNISITAINNKHYRQRAHYVVSQYVVSHTTAYVRASSSKNFIYPHWREDYENIRNTANRGYGYKSARLNQWGGWTYQFYTKIERYEKDRKISDTQTRLFDVDRRTNNYAFIRNWNNFLENKFTQKDTACTIKKTEGNYVSLPL